ncbi:MAG: M1 family aminopeptidase, partial [Bacteroidota bacterium]
MKTVNSLFQPFSTISFQKQNRLFTLLAALGIISLMASCAGSKSPGSDKRTAALRDGDTVTIVTDSIDITPDSEEEEAEVPAWAAKKYNYNPARTLKTDLVHTKLEVSFDWKKRELNGIATLTLKPWFYPQNTVDLDAVGFIIKSVKQVKKKKSLKAKYTYDSTVLHITLDSTYKRGQPYTLEIEYTARPEKLPKGGSAAINSDKGLFFINPDGTEPGKPRQIWTQGETQANSKWFPTIDSPNERCTQEMHITVDSSYRTLSNGSLSYSSFNPNGTRTDVWEQKLPHAPYLFMMAVGKFAVTTDKWKGMEVSYYTEPEYAKYARNIFGNTPEMIGFFSDRLGVKYPWAKYSQVVVRDYVSGAMENTSATVLMEAVQADDKELADKSWDDIISHELF